MAKRDEWKVNYKTAGMISAELKKEFNLSNEEAHSNLQDVPDEKESLDLKVPEQETPDESQPNDEIQPEPQIAEEPELPEQEPQIQPSKESVQPQTELLPADESPQDLEPEFPEHGPYINDYVMPKTMFPKQSEDMAQAPEYLISHPQPLTYEEKDDTEPSGFFATTARGMAEGNWGYKLTQKIIDGPDHINPVEEEIPDGWQVPKETFIDTPAKYRPWLMYAHGPKQLELIQEDIAERVSQDEAYENGSLAGHLLSGVVSFETSPAALVPMAHTLKYSKTPGYIIKNMTRAVPGMAAQAAVHNTFLEGMETNPSLERIALNTFRDTIFGSVLHGAGLSFAASARGSSLYAQRKAMNHAYEGIGVKRVISEDGIDTGKVEVAPLKGFSVGSDKLNEAKEYYNSTIAAKGVFALPAAQKMYSKMNPQYRGMTSRFPRVKQFFQLTGESMSSMLNEGTLAGQETPETFEGIVNYYKDRSNAMSYLLKGLWHESNGIYSNLEAVRAVKAFKQRFDGGQLHTWDDFGNKVLKSIVTGTEHENKSINEAVARLKEHYKETYEHYREAMGFDSTWRPPVTAEEYATRYFDQDALNVYDKRFIDDVAEKFKSQDDDIINHNSHIESHNETIKNLNERVNSLEKDKSASKEELNKAKNDLRRIRARRLSEKRKLSNMIAKDRKLLMLADDKSALSWDESQELKQLLSKRDKLKKDFEDAKIAKDAELMRKLEDELYEEELRLFQEVTEGKINKNFVESNKSTDVKFKDPKKLLKFRDVFKSHDHRRESAEAYRNTIQSENHSQIYDYISDNMSGKPNSNPTAARTFMIEDQFFIEKGYVSTDLSANLRAYDMFMARKIAMKKTFDKLGVDNQEEFIEKLTENYHEQRKALNSEIYDPKKLAKAKRKIKSDFDEAQEDIKNTFDRMMGRTMSSAKGRLNASIARNFAVMTRLGYVPITMVADLAAVTLKHGFWPTIRDGILPMLEDLKNAGQVVEGRAIKENAAHAHLGLNHVQNGYADRYFAGDSISDIPIGTGWTNRLHNVTERLAHLTSNMAGTNHLDNLLQQLTATITQSKIISYMAKHEAGTLGKTELETLLMYNLDPNKWSKRFLDGWKQAGSDGNGFGGYMSHYYKWTDQEASNMMMKGIRRSVRDTILRSGMMSTPFMADSACGSLLFLFKGWGFEATARYTAPLLQAPDQRKLMGVMIMLGAGALVDPMRRFAKGQDPISDDDNMFGAAISNSGALGVLTDGLQDLNMFIGSEFLGKLTNDRYRDRVFMGMVGGPLGGVIEDIRRSTTMVASGKGNTSDVKKLMGLLPFMNLWQLGRIKNKMAESLGLPDTRADT